ncbi:putative WRKY transcription factor 72 [Senna tora]|uniref:Putative WRKY transcription factor 72 n=1 Tax=Senna tora TaxID=362788 RepID=A0A834W4C1_9FABA|nr:putative WRKY transcription factor 72 [Senna tora]
MHNFFDILQEDQAMEKARHEEINIIEENELVITSLSLGINNYRDDEKKKKKKKLIGNNYSNGREELLDHNIEGLELGLDMIRFDPSSSGSGSANSAETTNINPSPEIKVEEAEDNNIIIEAFPQAQLMKKARVSIRARCDTQTVQRCAEDMSILMTTYEGSHNHPLPFSAAPMVSTTSAAASLLHSPSSTTTPNHLHHHALNFSHYSSHIPSVPLFQPYFTFPNSSLYSTSNNSHPTITLDLTTPPPPNSSAHIGNLDSSNSFPLIHSTSGTYTDPQ